MNPGYNALVTLANYEYIKKHPTSEAIADEDVLENRELWNKIITNIDEYIHLDYYPVIYGTGLFKNLTYYMRTLKSTDFEESIDKIYKINSESKLSDSLSVKVGVKRKLIEEQIQEEVRPLNFSYLF